MDVISWIALVQPMILCIAFAGLQHSGVLNSFFDRDREYSTDTTDLHEKLTQLDDKLVASDRDYKEVHQSIATLTDVVEKIKSDMELIASGNMEQLGRDTEEFATQETLTHVAIVILSLLQLLTVILMSIMWIKMSKLQRSNLMGNDTDVKNNDIKENNNSEAEVTS